jgi:hypothetical protein
MLTGARVKDRELSLRQLFSLSANGQVKEEIVILILVDSYIHFYQKYNLEVEFII